MSPDKHKHRFLRWALLQAPELLILSGIMYILLRYKQIDLMTTAAIAALWLIKEIVLYNILSRSQFREAKTGAENLVGRIATTIKPLTPEGLVRIDGEIWRAVMQTDSENSGLQEYVCVEDYAGLLLYVSPYKDEPNDRQGRIKTKND